MKRLDHEDGELRAAVAKCLPELGGAASAATAALVQRVQTDDEEPVREAAARALVKLGPPAFAKLLDGLDSPDHAVRAHTLAAIATLGPDAQAAEPALAELLGDPHAADVRLAAVQAAGAIGPAAARTTGPLTRLLEDRAGDLAIRTAAATALGNIGGGASAAVPALTQVLHGRQEQPELRSAAAAAVAKISPESMPDLLRALYDPTRRRARGGRRGARPARSADPGRHPGAGSPIGRPGNRRRGVRGVGGRRSARDPGPGGSVAGPRPP